ncbi:hypothetical protein P152DRAFT_514716 [Eremomyces bilateralis CBS 781.70]|uniref:STEEP1 domain-containing protein n=1 Tax=Eremomyces bilateralis CBS 781.70 TaxID=1392243 RepID=A0A6G1G2B5_9PEZI|nr:uncharacterized protein P152DRAFT_514716 [Eremomyces bilateralis CBS 781.70]KAF1812066.1 hypothetical protein P152DRAFT_514716 [Eremomyces bilateralis CBS 781.70]
MTSITHQPTIHTYHCLCTQLLLATPHPLPTYPRRAPPSLDRAYILPLSPSSPTTDHPTTSLALPDTTPQIIRRADGFERRYWQRCGRCRLVVGYFLGRAQGDAEGERGVGAEGPWGEVLYVFPGGLVGTEEMVGGGEGVVR